MARLPDVSEGLMTSEQRAVFDRIRSGPRGKVEGPLRVWLHSPELADRSQALGAFCRYGSSLTARQREFVILLIGAEWRAGFEWISHAPLAREAGVPEAVIEAIHQGNDQLRLPPDLDRLRAFTLTLIRRHEVDQVIYDQVARALGRRGVVELVGLIGYYTYISMTIRAFEVDAPGHDPFA